MALFDFPLRNRKNFARGGQFRNMTRGQPGHSMPAGFQNAFAPSPHRQGIDYGYNNPYYQGPLAGPDAYLSDLLNSSDLETTYNRPSTFSHPSSTDAYTPRPLLPNTNTVHQSRLNPTRRPRPRPQIHRAARPRLPLRNRPHRPLHGRRHTHAPLFSQTRLPPQQQQQHSHRINQHHHEQHRQAYSHHTFQHARRPRSHRHGDLAQHGAADGARLGGLARARQHFQRRGRAAGVAEGESELSGDWGVV